MKEQIEEYFKKYNVKIVPMVYQVDDTELDRCFQYVRETLVPFTLDDFKKEMDKLFPREHAKYLCFDYKSIVSPIGMGERHFIRMNFDDGRDEITKRNDKFYEDTKRKINDLLYDDYGNDKFVYKKDMIKLLEQLRSD